MGATSSASNTATSSIKGLSSIGSAYSSAIAQRAQGDYQKSMYDANAEVAKYEGQDAINRGDVAAGKQDVKTSQVIADQRSSYGAQGVDVNTGSAAQVQASTNQVGALDALTIKNNAWREAWGYGVQANNYTDQGNMTKLAADNSANSTLVTGGMKGLGYGLAATYSAGQGVKNAPTAPKSGSNSGGSYFSGNYSDVSNFGWKR